MLLTFCLFPNESISLNELLKKAELYHDSWVLLNNNNEKLKLDYLLKKENFSPDFNFAANPIYNTGTNNGNYYNSVGLSSSMSWLLPSDGILSLSATDIFSFSQLNDEWDVNQSPQLSISYS